MQGAVLHGPRDIRFEERATPAVLEATDAIISLSATCICGSDLWPYRGIQSTLAEGYRAMDERRAIKTLLRP
jgi:threonine dehydrogenase-like Zn-dependent dehydrogenase